MGYKADYFSFVNITAAIFAGFITSKYATYFFLIALTAYLLITSKYYKSVKFMQIKIACIIYVLFMFKLINCNVRARGLNGAHRIYLEYGNVRIEQLIKTIKIELSVWAWEEEIFEHIAHVYIYVYIFLLWLHVSSLSIRT